MNKNDISKMSIGVGAALAIAWAISHVTWSGGGKMDELENLHTQVIELRSKVDDDHDKMIGLKTIVDRMADEKQPVKVEFSK